MPLAVLIPLIEGLLAGIPSDISAFNAIKAAFEGGKSTITAAELQGYRDQAVADHAATQNA